MKDWLFFLINFNQGTYFYFVAIYNFDGRVQHGLALEIGETVQILEVFQLPSGGRLAVKSKNCSCGEMALNSYRVWDPVKITRNGVVYQNEN